MGYLGKISVLTATGGAALAAAVLPMPHAGATEPTPLSPPPPAVAPAAVSAATALRDVGEFGDAVAMLNQRPADERLGCTTGNLPSLQHNAEVNASNRGPPIYQEYVTSSVLTDLHLQAGACFEHVKGALDAIRNNPELTDGNGAYNPAQIERAEADLHSLQAAFETNDPDRIKPALAQLTESLNTIRDPFNPRPLEEAVGGLALLTGLIAGGGFLINRRYGEGDSSVTSISPPSANK